jgi:hypothetical protein
LQSPSCQDGGLAPPAISTSPWPESHTNTEKDASCQPLQPTCCQRVPAEYPTPERATHAAMPAAFVSHTRQRVNAAKHARQPRRRRIAVAGISDLRWPTQLVLRKPAAATTISSNEGPGLPERSPASALSADCELDGVTTDAPCRQPRWCGCPHSEEGQNVFPDCSTKSPHSARPERLPPIGPTNLVPTCAKTIGHGPPLVPWLGRQEPSFRHGFTHNLVR